MSTIDKDILRMTGMTVREDIERDTTAVTSPATRSVPQRRSARPQYMRLVTDLITLAMGTDHRVDQYGHPLSDERKRRDATARLVMNPNDPTMPLEVIVFLILGDEDISNKGVGRMYRALDKIEIPEPGAPGGLVKVEAAPHLVCDGMGGRIMYGTPSMQKNADGQPGLTIKMREHSCVVMRPLPGASLYKLLPYGLARPMTIRTWNSIAEQLTEQGLQTIDAIPHNLYARDRTKFIVFRPAGLFRYMTEEDKVRLGKLRFGARKAHEGNDPIATKAADEALAAFEPTGPYNYGKIDGMSTVSLDRDSNIPPFDDSAKFAFTREHVFVAQPQESRLGLMHVGPLGEAQLVKGSVGGLSSSPMNPFDALGKLPHEVDRNTVADLAYKLANSKPDMDNSLWKYAIEHEYLDALVTRTDVIQAVLSGLAQTVINRMREMFDTIHKELSSDLIRAYPPDLEDILAGQTVQTVYWRRSGADVLATWMAEKMECGQFLWSSTLHRLVRQDILANCLSLRGEGIPEIPNFVTTTAGVRQDPRKKPPQAQQQPRQAPMAKPPVPPGTVPPAMTNKPKTDDEALAESQAGAKPVKPPRSRGGQGGRGGRKAPAKTKTTKAKADEPIPAPAPVDVN